MSEWNLNGKEALILGGTHGIGLACAEEMEHLGAKVTVVARFHSSLNKYPFIQADITNTEDRKRIVEKIEKLDILVNNVG